MSERTAEIRHRVCNLFLEMQKRSADPPVFAHIRFPLYSKLPFWQSKLIQLQKCPRRQQLYNLYQSFPLQYAKSMLSVLVLCIVTKYRQVMPKSGLRQT